MLMPKQYRNNKMQKNEVEIQIENIWFDQNDKLLIKCEQINKINSFNYQRFEFMIDPEKDEQEMIFQEDSETEKSQILYKSHKLIYVKNEQQIYYFQRWLQSLDWGLANKWFLLILKISVFIFAIMIIPKLFLSYNHNQQLVLSNHRLQVAKDQNSFLKNLFNAGPKIEKMISCQRKFPSEDLYQKVAQSTKASLISGQFKNKPEFKKKRIFSEPIKQVETSESIKNYLIKANKQLLSPIYPKGLRQVISYKPFEDLPFCLFVKQSKKQSQQFKIEVAKSIFLQKYANYITIFYGDEEGLSLKQLQHIDKQIRSIVKLPSRMFYKIDGINPNYHQYQYLMHQLCVQKSYVLFVSSVLSPQALYNLNNFHQQLSVFLTISRDPYIYNIHSFPMRLFDLISINDFTDSNSKYLQKPNQQKFISLALLQLSKRFVKHTPIQNIYKQQYLNQTKVWSAAMLTQDATVYSRQPYQTLYSLSQNTKISEQEISQYLNQLQFGKVTSNNKSELQIHKLFQAIEQQQMAYLPQEYSLNKKLYMKRLNTYGLPMHYDKISKTDLDQRSFCVVLIGNNQTNLSVIRKDRFVRSVESVFRQNYSNFHIVYFDNGLEDQTKSQIFDMAKKFGFAKQKFQYIKSSGEKSRNFNILRANFQHCKPWEIQVVVDSDIIIIDPNFFSLANNIFGYQPDTWLLYPNFKTDLNNFGYGYRLTDDYEYRNFTKRAKGLNYLPPLPVFEVKLLRKIPLKYHLNVKQQWLDKCWLKSLQHAMAEVSSIGHINYIPEIQFSCSEDYIQNEFDRCRNSHEYSFIENQKLLKPFPSLETDKHIQQQIGIAIINHLNVGSDTN